MGAKCGVVCGMGKVGTIVETYHLLTTSVPFLMIGSKRPLTHWGVCLCQFVLQKVVGRECGCKGKGKGEGMERESDIGKGGGGDW